MANDLMMASYLAQARSHSAQAKVLRERVEHRSRLKDTDLGELVWAMIHAHEAATSDLLAALDDVEGVGQSL